MLYPDIIFVVQGQEFPAHKSILATRCKFFENMFESKLRYLPKRELIDVRRYEGVSGQRN